MWISAPYAAWATTCNRNKMIKKLRIKFMAVSMLLAAVMVVLLIALACHITRRTMVSEIRNNLSELNGFQGNPYALPPDCFILIPQEDGSVQVVTGHYAVPDQAQLQEYMHQAQRNRNGFGLLLMAKLRYYRLDDPVGSYAFHSVEAEYATFIRLLSYSILLGMVSLVIMFPISLLLIRSATYPAEVAILQQRQFVSDASHELKVPLTVILTNTQMLQDPDYNQQDHQRFVAAIQTMALQMRHLVEDLLCIARSEHHAQPFEMRQLDASALVEECAMLFEPIYYELERELAYDIQPGLTVKGDSNRLRQLVDILLDNGRKYSLPNSRIVIRLQRQVGHHCLLQITSRGETLTPQQCVDVFQRFYRTDSSRSNSASSGLGLSIAQQIVAEHRGKIWCTSHDGSTTFHVVLPTEKRK